MTYLNREDIILINRKMTLQFGGSFSYHDNNIKNKEAFEYAIESVNANVFEIELYPNIFTKCALYMYCIICNHIFHDGNKRTGLASSLLFLSKNGYGIKHEISTEDIVKFTYAVGETKLNIEEIAYWFETNTYKKHF
ncbi:MAG: type II toxin-antitoxin system death-on-curing family toxin [Ginsengibacter sp.]